MRTLEERLRLILAIVEKDLRIPLWGWAVPLLIAGLGFFFLLPSSLSAVRFGFAQTWTWYDFTLRPYYAVSVALTSFILAITFASFHGGEIRRGTIRSIILYPMDMNDITIAKLLSSFLVTAIISSILFFGVLGSFFIVGLFPAGDFLAIHVTALAMSFLTIAVGVSLAQWIAHLTGRMIVSPAALGAIFLFLAIVFTETALTAIGTQIVYLSTVTLGGTPGPQEFALVQSIAQGLSVFSPFHVGGRILGLAFGITRMWADLHVVVPVAILVVAGGYAFGKKVYLDVFVR